MHDVATTDLLMTLQRLHLDYLEDKSPAEFFDDLLMQILRITESHFGFIGEVRTDEQGRPFLKTQAVSNIAWDDESRAFYEKHAPEGMLFTRLDSLFGAVLTSGRPVISNDPANDPRRGGLPPGHPALHAFLGIPLRHGGRHIGMLGIANREGGYGEDFVDRLELLWSAAGALTGAFCNARDRREAESRLRESERRLDLAIQGGRLALWDWDVASDRIVRGDHWRVVLGHTADELPTSLGDWRSRIHPDDLPAVEDAVRGHLEGLTPLLELEYRERRKDGTWAWIRLRGAAVARDAGGAVSRVVGTALDVTESREAADTRQNLERQLRVAQRMESVGQLAGGIAHDFNNLLLVILGELELIGPVEDAVGEGLENIRVAAERAAALTQQLLTLSRKKPAELVSADLNDQIRGALQLLARVIPESHKIDFVPASDLWRTEIDRGQFDQVLLNLCINARDAMPEGGRITMCTENVVFDAERCLEHPWAKPGRYVALRVTDQGVGMPPGMLEKIFEPFFTTKMPGEGTGLGLAMVYGIVRQHRGLLHVDSEVGEGTRFDVYLPASEQVRSAACSDLEAPIVGGDETILVAEDEELVRQLVVNVLQAAGYRVVAACDGQEALDIIDSQTLDIDLVLLDAVMPRLSGRRTFELLQERQPGMRALFTSGYARDSLPSEFLARWNLQSLQKPYRPEKLLRMVREILDRP
ncbi:MAG: GAF domain-containing protein [Myxococcales bacterium]|nr:GAF domain-containing protein [Myxococcales bacterium]MDH5306021.1 GAF domain-containing protein [Myxococcales bacterium]MDH5566096.1 GAF domain-containing protein [Myxococcales bacterium]